MVELINLCEKCAQVKLDHFPRDRGETKKRLKPPPKRSWKRRSYPILRDKTEITVVLSHKRKKEWSKIDLRPECFLWPRNLRTQIFQAFPNLFKKKKGPLPRPQPKVKNQLLQHIYSPPNFPQKKRPGTRNPKRRKSIALCGIASTCWWGSHPPRCRMYNSLKLTAKAPKNGGFPIGIDPNFQGSPIFRGKLAVSFREGSDR